MNIVDNRLAGCTGKGQLSTRIARRRRDACRGPGRTWFGESSVRRCHGAPLVTERGGHAAQVHRLEAFGGGHTVAPVWWRWSGSARRAARVPGMGTPPPEHHVDAWMRHLVHAYDVGPLTAAARHGPTHRAPQVFHVVTTARLRDRAIGRSKTRAPTSTLSQRTPRPNASPSCNGSATSRSRRRTTSARSRLRSTDATSGTTANTARAAATYQVEGLCQRRIRHSIERNVSSASVLR